MSMLLAILQKINQENKNDKFFKIRPVTDAVRKNSMAIKPEPAHSIDEQIKTKLSGIRQYNPNKPKK